MFGETDPGWVSMADWLGYEKKAIRTAGEYPPFLEARAFVHTLEVKDHSICNLLNHLYIYVVEDPYLRLYNPLHPL